MRYIRYGFYLVLAIVLVTVAMANRSGVMLHLLPEQLAEFSGIPNSLELPLFVIIFASIVAGLLIGFVLEWLREHKDRSEAAHDRRDKRELQREVNRLKESKADEKDEILALLEKSA